MIHRPATPADMEVALATMLEPVEFPTALVDRVRQESIEAWATEQNGELLCVWGIVAQSLLSERAYLWAITTSSVRRHRVAFLRECLRKKADLLSRFTLIDGHIVTRFAPAMHWIAWLGGTFRGTELFGPMQEPCFRFEMRN